MTKKLKKTRTGAHDSNPRSTAAKGIGTTLAHFAMKVSEVAASGQQEALLPSSVEVRKPRKKATSAKRVIEKKAVSNGTGKSSSKTGSKTFQKPAFRKK